MKFPSCKEEPVLAVDIQAKLLKELSHESTGRILPSIEARHSLDESKKNLTVVLKVNCTTEDKAFEISYTARCQYHFSDEIDPKSLNTKDLFANFVLPVYYKVSDRISQLLCHFGISASLPMASLPMPDLN